MICIDENSFYNECIALLDVQVATWNKNDHVQSLKIINHHGRSSLITLRDKRFKIKSQV